MTYYDLVVGREMKGLWVQGREVNWGGGGARLHQERKRWRTRVEEGRFPYSWRERKRDGFWGLNPGRPVQLCFPHECQRPWPDYPGWSAMKLTRAQLSRHLSLASPHPANSLFLVSFTGGPKNTGATWAASSMIKRSMQWWWAEKGERGDYLSQTH